MCNVKEHQSVLRDSNLIFKPLNSRFVNNIFVLNANRGARLQRRSSHRSNRIVHPMPDETMAAVHIISYIYVPYLFTFKLKSISTFIHGLGHKHTATTICDLLYVVFDM